MSEHQKQTAFFKQIFRMADTPERRHLKGRILKAEGDVCCCRRAMLRLLGLVALSVVGFLYSVVMAPDVVLAHQHVLRKVFQVVAIGSTLSLLAYAGCWLYYRAVLFQVHTECRRYLMGIMGTREEPDAAAVSSGDREMYSSQAIHA